jgi:hypothetical protein
VRIFILRRCGGLVVDQENFGLEERTFLIYAEEFETPTAFGDEVEATVGIFFDDGHDFGGASHLGEALLDGAYDAESLVPGEALADHLFVTWLENVQGQGRAGEQDNVEREEGDQ